MEYNYLKREYLENGYCVLRDALTPKEIQQLVEQTKKVLRFDDGSEDFFRLEASENIHKIKYMFEKSDVFLQYLVHPSILKLVSELSEDVSQIVPTWEDMLIKVPFKGIPVIVHQDLALQSVAHDVFSIGIYLHDSHENPVYYLPKSHKMGPLTRNEIRETYNKFKDDFIPMYANAGDIVVHNVKTVHYSEKNESSNPRYTWYLEFRTIEQLKKDSPWDDDWIMSRRAIWAYALQKYHYDIGDLIPDINRLTGYLENLQLKVSHINEMVNYDLESPYNHFI